MRAWYIEGERLIEGAAADKDAASCSVGVVETVSPAEVREVVGDGLAAEALLQLPFSTVPFCEVEGSRAVGVVVVPDLGAAPRTPVRWGFVLERDRLRLVGEGAFCEQAIAALCDEGVPVSSVAAVLAEALRFTVRGHQKMLSDVRDSLERAEVSMLDDGLPVDRAGMHRDRRRIFMLDTFYQGMSDIAEELSEGAGGLVEADGRTRFGAMARHFDRLGARVEALHGYSLQLDAMYQEGVDVRQNRVMQWLTVVATIFMPLTFITGWYGMNFPNLLMPGFAWGYPLVGIVCIAVAVFEVRWFRSRGWLGSKGSRRCKRR